MLKTSAILVAALCALEIPALADTPSPICPDRPGKGTSPCTVDMGSFQAEVGLFDESLTRRSGTTTDFEVAGNTLLKYGVSSSLDLEAGLPLYQAQRVHDATGTAWSRGVGDLTLHAKWNTGAEGFAFVLDPYVKLPTAGGGLGNDHVEGGLVAPAGFDLGNNWSLSFTPEADLMLNGTGSGYHANLSGVLGIGRSFGDLSLGAEIWTDQNIDPAAGAGFYSFDLSAAYLTDNDTQLDGGINLGLNKATPDVEFYFGISRRV